MPRNSELQGNADPGFYDLGLCTRDDGVLASREDLCGLFKVPSLRNVALRKRYFHSGRFGSLRDVVDFYVTRDTEPARWYPTVSGEVLKFDDPPASYHGNVNTSEPPCDRQPGDAPALSAPEVDDVIAFLRTLTDWLASVVRQRLVGEQVVAQCLLEAAVGPPDPLQQHRRMLLLELRRVSRKRRQSVESRWQRTTVEAMRPDLPAVKMRRRQARSFVHELRRRSDERKARVAAMADRAVAGFGRRHPTRYRRALMRRIYFLAPSVASARAIVNDLLLARIEERHIHVLAKEGTPLEDLPEAKLAQASDLIASLERGAAAGGLTGLLAGLVAVTFPPAGLALGGGALLGIALLGTGFGAWMSSMVGVGIPNSRLEQFQDAIAKGELLMMIDVPRVRVEEIEAVVRRHHPEAELEGLEPNIPEFP